ncbi:MAG: hypothetical protein WD431_10435 [Cyclobacteriaceae bacterium]
MDSLAFSLIKKNLETKDPHLDLGGCGLTGIEKELELLGHWDHLETLIISDMWHEHDAGWIFNSNDLDEVRNYLEDKEKMTS